VEKRARQQPAYVAAPSDVGGDGRSERSVFSRHVLASELSTMPIGSIRPRDVEAFAMWVRSRAG